MTELDLVPDSERTGLIGALPARLDPTRSPCPHGCDTALTYAVITAPDKRNPDLMAKLDAIAGRVLKV